ncbi:MAG: ankyrin repeat domain-containing protein, partial [Candidatus Aminicenantes bacterium]
MSYSKKIGFYVLSVILLFSVQVLYTVNKSLNEVNNEEFQKAKDKIIEAASNGDLKTVKKVLKIYPELIKAKRRGGWTLLHVAKNRKLVKYLLEKGADINAESNGGSTPLHNYAYKGHKDEVELLLKKGADLEANRAYGRTPLINAIKLNRIEVVKVLVKKGANVNATNKQGR